MESYMGRGAMIDDSVNSSDRKEAKTLLKIIIDKNYQNERKKNRA